MKIFKNIILLFFLLLICTSFFGQSRIDEETSYLFFLKIFDKDLNETVKNAGWGNTSWLEFYANGFDKYNFEAAKNDEFKRNKYYNQIRQQIKNKISALNFKKEYYIMLESQFGEYNFSDNSFPITSIFQGRISEGIPLRNKFEVPLKIGWIINNNYFDYKLKLAAEKAEMFINNRKNTSGYVNRTIDTKIIFTFVNQPLYNGYRESNFENTELIIYITRIEFYNNGQLISTLIPTIKFEDPISGYKVLNGQEVIYYNGETYDGETIVVNRVNGLPDGPVFYYNSKNNSLSRIVNCSYFFPTVITYSGDDVKFMGTKGKEIPYSITQYKDGHLQGYYIYFDYSNGFALTTVSITDENGIKTVITQYSVFTGFKKVKEMPTDVQELIMKYDYGKYYQYSENLGNSKTVDNRKDSILQKKNIKEEQKKNDLNNNTKTNITYSEELNKILISSINGSISKKYLAGNTDMYIDKKAGTKQPSNIVFLFSNKQDEIPYQSQLIFHVSNWIKESMKLTDANINDFKKDSLFKIEFNFTEQFRYSSTSSGGFWYADLTTNIHITKNGLRLKDETFTKSTNFLLGKRDKWDSLKDAIEKSEKKINNILSEYIPVD